jgi:hypothetical protein
MSSEIKANSIQDKTGTRVLASDSGSAWSWGSGLPKGSVIEQFASPCDGSSITVQSGSYTVQNVTGSQALTTSFADVTGSALTYTPPAGTQTVIYDFLFQWAFVDANSRFGIKLSIGGTEVTNARTYISSQSSTYTEQTLFFRWAFNIGGSTTNATGRQATWTSGKEIKLETREHSSAQEINFHTTYHWEGAENAQFNQPTIGITALA